MRVATPTPGEAGIFSFARLPAYDLSVMVDALTREAVLFTVSREVAQAAIAQVASCEACNPDAAEFPFECILDRVMLFSGVRERNQRFNGLSSGEQSLQRS